MELNARVVGTEKDCRRRGVRWPGNLPVGSVIFVGLGWVGKIIRKNLVANYKSLFPRSHGVGIYLEMAK